MSAERSRDRRVLGVLVLEGGFNGLALLAKLSVALATGSVALLADAVHSLTDMANNVIAWFAIRLAQEPADRDHPYGHAKFETLAVFGLATLLAVAAVEIASHALGRESVVITQSDWGVAVMLGVLVGNVGVTLWEGHMARVLDSEILRADAAHTLSDVLVTLALIAGWQLAVHGLAWADTLLALAVSAFILFLAVRLLLRAIPTLVDHAAIEPDALERSVEEVPGVVQVRRSRSRAAGAAPAIDVVVSVAPDMPTRDAHAIADSIERKLREEFGAEDVSVHVEPHGGGRGGDPQAIE